MSKSEEVREFLRGKGLDEVARVYESPVDDELVVVHIDSNCVDSRKSSGKTSRRQLSALRRSLSKRDIRVEFVIVDVGSNSRTAAFFYDSLVRQVSDYSGGVHLISTGKEQPVVVVNCEQALPSKTTDKLKLLAEAIARAAGFESPTVEVRLPRELPTDAAILRTVKIVSPVDEQELAVELKNRGFDVEDGRWLVRRLERLRKSGLALRSNEGKWVVTESGLQVVPAGRRRSSSDIERALFLARRKW